MLNQKDDNNKNGQSGDPETRAAQKFLRLQTDPGETMLNYRIKRTAVRILMSAIIKSRAMNRIIVLFFGLFAAYSGISEVQRLVTGEISGTYNIVQVVIIFCISIALIYFALPMHIQLRTTYYLLTDVRLRILIKPTIGKVTAKDVIKLSVKAVDMIKEKDIILETGEKTIIIKPEEAELFFESIKKWHSDSIS